jgi:hypothetical protein
VRAAADGDGVVWLCRPGDTGDPCMTDESSTTVSPAKDLTVVAASAATTGNPVDCFYVYPTVSTQTTANADLTVEAGEIKAAKAQASRFSSVCDVWAPMYRQRPLNAPDSSTADAAAAGQVAYDSVVRAWHDYLEHFNDGKPIVVLGHSQGSAVLVNFLQDEVDNDETLRARLVSALILGGNVEVPAGEDVGATFQHIPVCRAPTQTGCVIAYSGFPAQPAPDAVFGIAGQGIGAADRTSLGGTDVLCTNPASLADPNATAALDPYFWIADRPSRQVLTTNWVSFPALYTAECHSRRRRLVAPDQRHRRPDRHPHQALTGQRTAVGISRLRHQRRPRQPRERRHHTDHRLPRCPSPVMETPTTAVRIGDVPGGRR